MKNDGQLHEILKDVFDTQYRAIGNETVQDILDGTITLDHSDGGKRLDLGTALAMLGDAAALVSAVLMTYDVFVAKNNRIPSADEVRNSLFANLSDADKDRLISRALQERASNKGPDNSS